MWLPVRGSIMVLFVCAAACPTYPPCFVSCSATFICTGSYNLTTRSVAGSECRAYADTCPLTPAQDVHVKVPTQDMLQYDVGSLRQQVKDKLKAVKAEAEAGAQQGSTQP